MSNSRASKRQTNMYNYKYMHRGKFFDDIQRETESEKRHILFVNQKRKEMTDRILELISCFEEEFSMNKTLLNSIQEEVFNHWKEKQNYAKELAHAMIQIANFMKLHGYQDELKVWIDTVHDKFGYLYKE